MRSDLHQYRYLRNQVTTSISRHKMQFILKELNLNEGKPEKTWKVLKQLLTSNKHASGNFDIGAESFNIFFSPVGTNVTKHYGPLILPPLLERTTHFLLFIL